ncbi:MAG TPA: hypothetical protein VGM90_17740 [Kofleriaceae bacterium]
MALLAATLAVGSIAHADDAPWRVSIDTDPTTFPLGGFSGWAMVKPAGMQHLRVGAGGFGLDFPSFLVPTLNGNDEDGWNLGVRAVMAFAGYQFGERRGLYVGAYSGYLQSRHTRDDMPGTAVRDNITVLPTVGYQWFPVHHGALTGLYLQPWAGATIWFPVGGTTKLGTHEFKDPHVIPIAALHVGYEF